MPLTETDFRLLGIGVVSRILVFLLQLFCNAIPDHAADAFSPPPPPDSRRQTSLDSFLREKLLAGFAKWDSLHFLHVAEFGHLFESDLAFFPGLPLALRGVDAVLLRPPLGAWLSDGTRLLLAATLTNGGCFLASGVLLHRLGTRLSVPADALFHAVVWFYFNPASVFFAAAYSESLFFVLVLGGLLLFHRRHRWAASIVFALAGAVRSNGVVFAGFFWFFLLQESFKVGSSSAPLSRKCRRCLTEILRVATLTATSSSLLLAYQSYAASLFCRRSSLGRVPPLPSHLLAMAHARRELIQQSYAVDRNASGFYVEPAKFPAWCGVNSIVPFSYSTVQSKYWNLGPFVYYEWKQIPNFLLATPIVIVTLRCVARYAAFVLRNEAFSLGSLFEALGMRTTTEVAKKKRKKTMTRRGKASKAETRSDESGPSLSIESNGPLLSIEALPFYCYTLFFLVFGLCFMHVQVLTRLLLSSCPILYYYVGFVISKGPSPFRSFLRLFAVGYCFVGVMLHCNFLPWT